VGGHAYANVYLLLPKHVFRDGVWAMTRSIVVAAVIAAALSFSTTAFANCIGYAGPGGPCYTGPGGGLYTGPGGGAYTGPGGGAYTGPGGGAYTGPGGGAYAGPGGACYSGPGGGGYDKWNRPSPYCQ
jgi:hypothetical protein